jgi:hypothetical protein
MTARGNNVDEIRKCANWDIAKKATDIKEIFANCNKSITVELINPESIITCHNMDFNQIQCNPLINHERELTHIYPTFCQYATRTVPKIYPHNIKYGIWMHAFYGMCTFAIFMLMLMAF